MLRTNHKIFNSIFTLKHVQNGLKRLLITSKIYMFVLSSLVPVQANIYAEIKISTIDPQGT